jgi:hypothetical protein
MRPQRLRIPFFKALRRPEVGRPMATMMRVTTIPQTGMMMMDWILWRDLDWSLMALIRRPRSQRHHLLDRIKALQQVARMSCQGEAALNRMPLCRKHNPMPRLALRLHLCPNRRKQQTLENPSSMHRKLQQYILLKALVVWALPVLGQVLWHSRMLQQKRVGRVSIPWTSLWKNSQKPLYKTIWLGSPSTKTMMSLWRLPVLGM